MLAIGLALLGLVVTAAANLERQRIQTERDKWGGHVRGEAHQRGPRLTRAEAEQVPEGLTRTQLITRLGAPATTGIQRIFDEPDLRCVVYRSTHGNAGRSGLHAFCFRDGRYEVLREW